jgi:hypothetical protein
VTTLDPKLRLPKRQETYFPMISMPIPIEGLGPPGEATSASSRAYAKALASSFLTRRHMLDAFFSWPYCVFG